MGSFVTLSERISHSQFKKQHSSEKKLCSRTSLRNKPFRFEKSENTMKRIRIICHDPDMTDDSSSEDENDSTMRKKIVTVIKLPVVGLTRGTSVTPETVNSCEDSSTGNKTVMRRRVSSKSPTKRQPASMFKGVRKRTYGKWAAEIRNPFTSCRIWLGTFSSPEEASNAYQTKRLEFEQMVAASNTVSQKTKNKSEFRSLSESTLSQTSTSSMFGSETSGAQSNITQMQDQLMSAAPMNQELNLGLDFDFLFMKGDFGNLFDDYCVFDDFQLCGLGENVPSDLPDFDFDLAWMDEPLNIACL